MSCKKVGYLSKTSKDLKKTKYNMNLLKTISGWFSKPTSKLTCSCGSTNIKTEMSYKRTGTPKNVTKVKGAGIGARISYGYKFKKHTCNKCGNVWEESY